MKSIDQIKRELSELDGLWDFNPLDVEQGSKDWLTMKLGVISATGADALLAAKTTQKRKSYISGLAAQICTGERPEISSKPLDWGNEHESSARSIYEYFTENELAQLPIVYKDESLRVACSPDGYGTPKGCEIKCPYSSSVYIDFAALGIIKPEYIKQVQFTMWVTGAEEWDFCNYDPRMKVKPFHSVTIERDLGMMKTFEDSVYEAIWEIDKILKTMGTEWGQQWV